MKIVTGNEFENVIKDGKVLVDFYADWCGPCKMQAPVLEELSKEMSDVTIVKVNVDNDPATAQKYGVMSIPTLVLFKDGQVAAQKVGYQAKQQLMEFITQG